MEGIPILTICIACFLPKKVSCVAFPEEEGLQLGPDGRHVPVLAENVSRVGLAAHEVESNDSVRNGLAATMVQKHIVLLVKTRVWHRHAIGHGLVVAKQPRRTFNGNAEVSESVAQINDLICGSFACNALGSKFGGFTG